MLYLKDNIVKKSNKTKKIQDIEPNFITNKNILSKNIPFIVNHYDEQTKIQWTVNEIPIDYDDINNFFLLEKQKQNLIKAIILFFTHADKLVINNIDTLKEVPYEEAKNFYNLQINIEDIHDQVYMKIARLYYRIDDNEKNNEIFENDVELLNSIIKSTTSNNENEIFDLNDYTCPYLDSKDESEKTIFYAVTKKINLINKWRNVKSYVHNLVAFFCIESLAFNTLFTIIRLFKNNNKGVKYLVDVNEFVEKDERIHASYGITLYKLFVQNKLKLNEISEIIKEIADVEIEFISSLIPHQFENYNINNFINFIKYQANMLFKSIDNKAEDIYFNLEPVCKEFIIQSTLTAKPNFFERQSVYEINSFKFSYQNIDSLF